MKVNTLALILVGLLLISCGNPRKSNLINKEPLEESSFSESEENTSRVQEAQLVLVLCAMELVFSISCLVT